MWSLALFIAFWVSTICSASRTPSLSRGVYEAAASGEHRQVHARVNAGPEVVGPPPGRWPSDLLVNSGDTRTAATSTAASWSGSATLRQMRVDYIIDQPSLDSRDSALPLPLAEACGDAIDLQQMTFISATGIRQDPREFLSNLIKFHARQMYLAVPGASVAEPISDIRCVHVVSTYIKLFRSYLQGLEEKMRNGMDPGPLTPPNRETCENLLATTDLGAPSSTLEPYLQAGSLLLGLLPRVEIYGPLHVLHMVFEIINAMHRHYFEILPGSVDYLLYRRSRIPRPSVEEMRGLAGIEQVFGTSGPDHPWRSTLGNGSDHLHPQAPAHVASTKHYAIDAFCRRLVARLQNHDPLSRLLWLFSDDSSPGSLNVNHEYAVRRIAEELARLRAAANELHSTITALHDPRQWTICLTRPWNPRWEALQRAAAGGYGKFYPLLSWIEALADIAIEGYAEAYPGERPELNYDRLIDHVCSEVEMFQTRIIPEYQQILAERQNYLNLFKSGNHLPPITAIIGPCN